MWTSGSLDLDASIFTVKEARKADFVPCVSLTSTNPHFGQQIDLVEHPLGLMKKITIKSDEDVKGVCTIDKYNGSWVFPKYWCYECDMAQGASGSPVFDYKSGHVVGINSFIINDCPNFGAKMSYVKKAAGSHVGFCSSGMPFVVLGFTQDIVYSLPYSPVMTRPECIEKKRLFSGRIY